MPELLLAVNKFPRSTRTWLHSDNTVTCSYRSSLPALLAPRWTSWLRRTAWTGSTRCAGRCQAGFAQGAYVNVIIDMLPGNTKMLHHNICAQQEKAKHEAKNESQQLYDQSYGAQI